ncbi:MAG: ABC transporter permease [Tannerellaceae bacterium]|jgi:lipoprotein-releasing system permease protein|nr:ABC transporter permease [Tannerellaceae bacterium]
MNIAWILARRIHSGEGGNRMPAAVKMAVAGVALGIGVMILSVAIFIGFKQEVGDKVVGFGGHVVISNFDDNVSYESEAISVSGGVVERLQSIAGVRGISTYATKPGILKTDEDFQGVVLKGVSENYDWHFLSGHLVEGTTDSVGIGGGILLSRELSNLLRLGIGDGFLMYFVGENVKVRKFIVRGIYETGFVDFDRLFVLGSLDVVQGINGWTADEVSGIEILTDDFDKLDKVKWDVEEAFNGMRDERGNTFYVRSIKEIYPAIFGWLDVLDMNIVVILLLMLAVSGFTMIAGLLILILERTQMIGLLKGMGMGNAALRRTFLYVAFFLIGRGIFWGNLIGVGLCLIQKYGKVFPLEPSVYYLDAVPISLNLLWWIALNVGTLLITMAMLFGPSYLITRISPCRAIRFE